MKIKLTKRASTTGQALVEFALAATLIFFLLAAVVDLGLVFFTLQALHNAAEEGATYGSRNLVVTDGVMQVDAATIRDRARHEAGDKGIGFANLLDLNINGVDDATESGVVASYITVLQLQDTNGDGDPTDDGAAPNYTPCPSPSSSPSPCYVRVIVSADYKMLFPFVPSFAPRFRLNSPYQVLIRNGFTQSGP